MADIFISYKREQKETAEKLRRILENYGFSVWFDVELLSGHEFRPVIIEMMDQCKAVLVLWSELAVQSEFVIDEANYAKRQNKLCPAFLEPCDLPMGFGSIHSDDLTDWQGEAIHEGFNRLLRSLQDKVGRPAMLGAEPAATDRDRSEISDFQAVAKLKSAKAWKQFLKDYPTTIFKRFIEDRIEELEAQNAPTATVTNTASGGSSLSGPLKALVGLLALAFIAAGGYLGWETFKPVPAYAVVKLDAPVQNAALAARKAKSLAEQRAGEARRAAASAANLVEQLRAGGYDANILSFSDRMLIVERKDGGWNGLGELSFTTGRTAGDLYRGEFDNQRFSGLGVYTYGDNPNANEYFKPTESFAGQYEDGDQQGHGVATFKDGDTISGEISKSFFSGYAVQDYADGTRYEGQFAEDLPNGYGVLWSEDGKVLKSGTWKTGELE